MDELQTIIDRLKALPKNEQARAAFLFVRDIAYGDIGSRNPLDVLAKKKGTCSGKHALLKMILEKLGFRVHSYFAKHDFSKFPIQHWPEELKQFKSNPIPDFHDFLRVQIDGKDVTIDAIFDKPMESFGFVVADWDGKTDMALPVQATETFPAEGDMEEHKKKLIARLSEQDQKRRKEFLAALTKYLDEKRKI